MKIRGIVEWRTCGERGAKSSPLVHRERLILISRAAREPGRKHLRRAYAQLRSDQLRMAGGARSLGGGPVDLSATAPGGPTAFGGEEKKTTPERCNAGAIATTYADKLLPRSFESTLGC